MSTIKDYKLEDVDDEYSFFRVISVYYYDT